MVSSARLFTNVTLLVLIATLVLHLVAMSYPKWKFYQSRTGSGRSISVGIFQRCEHEFAQLGTTNKIYTLCDDNKYLTNHTCCTNGMAVVPDFQHRQCNLPENRGGCDYSSIGKGLIACTIIAACTVGIAFLLVLIHLFIGEFRYKIHLAIALPTVLLLLLGFLFLLTTMILLGSTMAYDIHQYKYNLNCRILMGNEAAIRDQIYNQTRTEYDIRLDWAGSLEIIALIGSSFALLLQILYVFSTYRNRIG